MLMPEQISNRWDAIRYAIERAVPPTVITSPEVMNNLLMSLLDGAAQCWISCKNQEDQSVDAILVTTVTEDFLSGTRTLMLYSLFGINPLDDVAYLEGFETLKKYARINRCIKLTVYTNVSRVVEMASKFGWDVEWMFLSYTL